MRAATRLFCACLVCVGVAACGGSSGSGGSDREQIMSLFSGLYTALQRGDYTTACADLSQRQQDNVVASARRAGLGASSCATALTSIFKAAGISRAQIANIFASGPSRKVNSISVRGNRATVTFSETASGHTYVETDALVRQGGRWRADRILKRTQTG
jgi:hypothetical protein